MTEKGRPIDQLLFSNSHIEEEENTALEQYINDINFLLSPGNSTFTSLKSAISRWLIQFRIYGSYSEAYIFNEAYIRGYLLTKQKKEQIKNVAAWLRRTSFNVIRELKRKDARFLPIFANTLDSSLKSSSYTDESDLLIDQEMIYIRLAFQMLNEEEQEILNLKIADELSWKEIQKEFQLRGRSVKLGALRKQKQRALNKLRENYHSFSSPD